MRWFLIFFVFVNLLCSSTSAWTLKRSHKVTLKIIDKDAMCLLIAEKWMSCLYWCNTRIYDYISNWSFISVILDHVLLYIIHGFRPPFPILAIESPKSARTVLRRVTAENMLPSWNRRKGKILIVHRVEWAEEKSTIRWKIRPAKSWWWSSLPTACWVK